MLSVWITIFLFCTVGGCLLYVLWKYRAKSKEEAMEIPEQMHGSSKIETTLILASSVILVILAVPTLQGVVLMNRVPDPNDQATLDKLKLDKSQIEDAITVNVTGKRFFWVFEYPQYGVVTANELVFPASKAVRVNLRTEDVIHSFWLPKLAGKVDLIPGQENFLWFIADQNKIQQRLDADGNPYKEDVETAMPSVFDGKMDRQYLNSPLQTNLNQLVVSSTVNVLNIAEILMLTCLFARLPRRMMISTNGYSSSKCSKHKSQTKKLHP